MNRKLIILNVTLALGTVYAGFQLHSRWVAAKAREAARLNRVLQPAPPPPLTPLPVEPAVLSTGYKDIALKTLFDPSRDPNVPVDVPPPPPPPKDPPPFPAFHGMMDLGDGPFAMMNAANSASQQEVHKGGMIGEFKLVDFSREEFAVEWDGRVFHKRTSETSATNNNNRNPGVEPINTLGIIPGIAAPTPQPTQSRELGPAATEVGVGNRGCQPGDSSAAGAVVDGYRKVLRPTMFGTECHWEPVGK